MRQLTNTLRIDIGGLLIEIISDEHILKIENNEFQKSFIASDKNCKPNVVYRIHFGETPSSRCTKELIEFKNEIVSRSLIRIEENIVFRSISSTYPFIYSVVFDIDKFSCDFYFQAENEIKKQGLNFLSRLFSTVHMIIFSSSQSFNGLFTHACAIKNNESGQIFVGKSGSGKSTLAKLCENKKNYLVLCDEMIIIRKLKNKFVVYGTPWVSDVKECSPQGVLLNNIFFIKHAKTNVIEPISPINAFVSLLNSSWLNSWNQNSMQNAFDLLSDLVDEIPIYELGFMPNEAILNFVRSVK